MNTKLMLWKLIFLFLLIIINCQDEVTPSLKLEQNLTLSVKASSSQKYTLQSLDYKEGKLWNLFFVAEPQKGSEWEDLDIHVYRKNSNENLIKLLSCEDIGVDSCVYHSGSLRSDDNLVVQFKCLQKSTSCNYTFKMYWSETYPIVINRGLRIDFEHEAYAKVFSLDLTNYTFTELRILLRAESFLAGTSPIKMVANYGTKTPAFNNYDIASIHLWDDGQGIFLIKNKMQKLKLTILIQGPAQNVLRLDTTLINQYNNNLTIQTPLYDFIGAQGKRSYIVNVSDKSIANDDIVVKISTFSGRLNVTFYQDKQLRNSIIGGQFSHHGQLQHRFQRSHLIKENVKDNLYILIQSPNYVSTFVISIYGKNDTMIKLSNDIQDMAEIFKKETINYYVEAFLKTNHTEGKQLMFSIHNILGKVRPYFSFCQKDNVEQCSVSFSQFDKRSNLYDTITPTDVTQEGTTSIYRINIPTKRFNQPTLYDNFKKVTVLLVFTSDNQPVKQFAIRYIDERVKILRDNHPLKDRLVLGEKRVYRSAAIEDDVLYVAVRLIQISGITKMFASNENPLITNVTLDKAIIPDKNQIIYYPQADGRRRTDPLFIVVGGQQNSLYSIVLTFYRDSSLNPDDKADYFNFITIPENIQQQLTIQSLVEIAIKLQTNRRDYKFIYSSSYPLSFCLRNDSFKFPKQPFCNTNITQTNFSLPNNQVAFIGIHNPNNKVATVKVKFTMNQQSCQIQRLGEVWRTNITEGKIPCVTYKISKKERIDVMISLDKLHTKQSKFVAILNGKSFQFNKQHFVLDIDAIQQICNNNMLHCQLTLSFYNISGSHLQVIAQSPGKQMVLLDGLAQTIFAPSSPTIPKYFRYYLVNKINTTFFVQSKKGYYQFQVNIVDATQLQTDWEKRYPVKGSAMYQSSGSRYTIYNQLQVTQEQINKLDCKRCVALITVLGTKDEYKQIGQFVIQVSQQARFLKEHQSALGYLAKQSFAFYEYYFPKEKGTLFISLSTQNIQCGRIYISKGNSQRASGDNYLNKSDSGELLFNAQKGLYSITVEAVGQKCHYLISASSTNFKLYQLKPGVYRDIQLQDHDMAYFFYHHISNTPFKIMSISKAGEAYIYAKVTNQTQIEYLQQNTTKIEQFTFKQSVDVLSIDQQTIGYKDNTLYLIAVQAIGLLDASILLYNGEVQIPLSNEDIVTDNLKNGKSMMYKTYMGDSQQLNISLDIYYGQLKVTVLDSNQSKIFKQNKQTDVWIVKLKRDATYKPCVVKIEAINDTLYSINLEYNSTSGQSSKIKRGLPLYLFIDKKQRKCVIADYQNQNQTLIASVYRTESHKLNKLKVTAKINSQNLMTVSEIVENTLVLSIHDKIKTNSSLATIEYCLENFEDFISLTLVSATNIVYIPEDTVMPVKKQGNFSLYLTGHVWIEILQCEGTSSLLLSTQFNKMSKSESQILFWRKFGNNYIMEVQHYGLTYMNIEGNHSLVRWGRIDKATGQGMGYYAIKMPDYTYKLKQQKININIPPVLRLNRATGDQDFLSKQNYGVFYLFITPSRKQLKQKVQCSQGQSFTQIKTFQNLSWKTGFDFSIKLAKIKEFYANEKYLFIGGAMELHVKINNNITQNYRFMIDSQQIPWTRAYQETDEDDDVSIKDNTSQIGNYLWIIIGFVTLIVLLCLFKFLLKRYQLKKRLLSNQNTGELQMRYSEHSVS